MNGQEYQFKRELKPKDIDKIVEVFEDFKSKERDLKAAGLLRKQALETTFNIVKPTFSEFKYDGEHLTDLDYRVGSPIKSMQEMIYASDQVQHDFQRTYLREFMKIAPDSKKHGYLCPYSIAHQLYRVASNNLLSLLEPISGVKAEKLSYAERLSYLSFISSFLNMKLNVS